MVAFTEFTAKRYKNIVNNEIIGELYVKKAVLYRNYADELWEMLCAASTDAQLQEIIDFCAEKEIITLKEDAQ